ncbi:MAG TPA: asparagine synthase-related protein, partial [Saprospiraceae bacterium]|nr:asparagine synthase-related protein [Saprospiraceae bacterium]
LLPQSVLWRRKNGFSDSVSSKAESWSVTLQKHIDTLVTDQEYLAQREQFSNNPPQTKEAYYYRKIFTQDYGKHQNLTPYQWLPKWCGDVIDPSARALEIYQAD